MEYKSVKECLFYIVTAVVSIVLRLLIIITPLILVVVFQKSTIFKYSQRLKILIKYLVRNVVRVCNLLYQGYFFARSDRLRN